MVEDIPEKPRVIIQDDELCIIQKCLEEGDVVFDVGAYHGEWSENIDRFAKNCELHLFEASPRAYETLTAGSLSEHSIVHAAVADKPGNLEFHVYPDKPRLSTVYRRRSVEDLLMPSGFETHIVPSICLDDYWPVERGLINFLKIDVEGAEFDVLRGANDLLRRGAVDYIQFEYGGTFKDAGTTLKLVFYYLKRHGYHLFKVKDGCFEHILEYSDALEDFEYANFLAVNERHLTRFKDEKPNISIYFDEIENLGISITGVTHIGAHDGSEVEDYLDRGLRPIILIEPNPKYAAQLIDRYRGVDGVFVAEKAISNQSGDVEFNIATSDQSSSLLELGTHARLYPNIKYSNRIKVHAQTLDECMSSLLSDPVLRSRANLMTIDIQGAELMALQGGAETLAHVDAIQLEVNYAELYQDCAIIWQLDEFLEEQGFVRVKTDTPFHRTWGDALYVRKPVVTNSTIGSLGRFGNHFFQYMFLKYHADDMNFDFEHSPWIGDKIFNATKGSDHLSTGLREVKQLKYSTQTCDILNGGDRLANSNLTGFFQYNTTVFKRHQESIQAIFSFKGDYLERLKYIRSEFDRRGGLVVGLHLRRGDYGNRWFFIAPTRWYVDWLRSLQKNHSQITVFIASDEPESVVPDFAEFSVLTAGDLLPSNISDPDFFDDFAALTICDKVAISNSSFSFAASMLNTRADEFVRPNLAEKRLVSYDPWRAEPLLRDDLAEDYGPEFMKKQS